MSIQAEVLVTIAEVEVDDDYMVTLRVHRKRTAYTPDEAMQLANELQDAAVEAATKLRHDLAAEEVPFRFDVADPIQFDGAAPMHEVLRRRAVEDEATS